MKHVISYVKSASTDFLEAPPNEVDALILGWLSYFNYPAAVQGERGIALEEARGDLLLPREEMYAPAFRPKASRKLFEALCKSPRFSRVTLSHFTAETDETEELQFAALCLRLAPDLCFLAFRGTDPSFLAWKEDFSLIYRTPLPSQRRAAEYTEGLMRRYPRARFFLGGHSKGGAAAVYAAARQPADLQARIERVFNFDGPGCLPQDEDPSAVLGDRLVKIVPNASFVGMLLECGGGYEVVRSRNLSFLQHDPFSWPIKGGEFVRAKAQTKASVRLARTVNDWIAALSREERKRLVELVFAALNTLDTQSFTVFFQTLYRQIPALVREYRNLPPDDRDFFNDALKRLNQCRKKKDV